LGWLRIRGCKNGGMLFSIPVRAGPEHQGMEWRRVGRRAVVGVGSCGELGRNWQGMVKVRMSELKLRPGRGHPKRGAGW
jgi:hypothetical protein